MNNIAFLDFVSHSLKLKNDAALARLLGVTAPVVSKIRHGRLPVGPSIVIKAHAATGISVADLVGSLGVSLPVFASVGA